MIIALFAVDYVGGLGFKNKLPWPHNVDDMKWFKDKTINQVVVMGHTTWNSEGMLKPLPNRTNVVVTNSTIDVPDVQTIHGNLPFNLRVLQHKYPTKNIYIIGGKNILLQSLSVIEKMFITKIPGCYDSDVLLNLHEFTKDFYHLRTYERKTCSITKWIRND